MGSYCNTSHELEPYAFFFFKVYWWSLLNYTVVDFVYTNLKLKFLISFIFLYGLENNAWFYTTTPPPPQNLVL